MSPAAGDASGRAPIAPALSGEHVLGVLDAHPGGAQLMALAQERDDLALVGGAVRDLLLGRIPRELDVALASGAADFARELAASVGRAVDGRVATARPATTVVHERFGTAVVEWEDGRVDIAERRAESYPRPGALPEVRPGSVEEDLGRRDFTVNAIAVPLGGARRGEALAAEHALEDLAAGRLCVLHERSFIDDPTRLLRLGRYSARLGFAPDRRTGELAAEALAAGALSTVSGARVGAELRLALGEADAVAALACMSALGVLGAVHPALCLREHVARRALALLPADGRPDLLLMASLLLALSMDAEEDPEEEIYELLDRLEFTLFAHTLEAVALGGALGEESATACDGEATQWFQRLRHVRLAINGDDLIAAGVPAGPEIGRRLAAALARKLDGELAEGRDAELWAAMESHG
jgi:tRNA nucleotidyltransferase (CCA-adding enzyme)